MESLNLGKKLQDCRRLKGLSIRELSEKSGITASMLSQIEHEQVNPSINTLRTLAASLSTPLYCFFKEDDSGDAVVHADKRKTISTKVKGDVVYELLTPDVKGNIEFCLMEIPPHSDTDSECRSHAGEEVAFVLSGQLVLLEMEEQLLELHSGDSVRIPPLNRHRWRNRSDDAVIVIFAVSPPSF